MASLDFEGREVALEPGDTLASALYRAGVRTFSRSFKYHRARGLYCLTGDCPNCLVTVDGEPCVQACVIRAADGQRVVRENAWPTADRDVLSVLWRFRRLLPVGFYYKLLVRPRAAWPVAERLVRRIAGIGRVPLGVPPSHREARHHHPDLLVVGGGVAGLSAALAGVESGRSVVLADEGMIGEKVAPGPTRTEIDRLLVALRATESVTILERATAIGIYEGPLVPVDGEDLLHLVHPERIVVATGAVEEHGLFPGNDLTGVWLGRGAARLAGVHGLSPGHRVVYAGEEGESLDVLREAGVEVVRVVAGGDVLAAQGRKSVRAVVVESGGRRERIPCDALVLSLGLVPRDGLLRQAAGLPVVGAGDVVASGCTSPGRGGGFVCLCEDVETRDLEVGWEEGFRSTELLKRYTTATMGPCQGILCDAHLRAFVRELAGESAVSAPTTARPPSRPIRLEDAAAGIHFSVEQRTALHERHLELGAQMEWAGGWRRPESYGDVLAEYWAVRRAVSVMDVGTLGKFLVAGRDAVGFLERLYPCHVHDLRPGALRYSLLLNEAGYVIDDGVICPFDVGYYVTCTTGGAEQAEAWLRNWAETWGYDVHIANQTHALGAINVAGPRARELLARLSDDHIGNGAFPYLQQRLIGVAGVPCRALRLGFTGELGFELHHPRAEGVRLWDALLEAGEELGLVPHGLEALRLLRLEKGHVIVGQDTDFDTTPAKLGMSWAAKTDKPDFVGKRALERISELPPAQKLAAIQFEGPGAPPEGSPLVVGGRHVGHLTSSRFSPVLGHGVALGWIRPANDAFPESVMAGEMTGQVVPGPFYDPVGAKLRA